MSQIANERRSTASQIKIVQTYQGSAVLQPVHCSDCGEPLGCKVVTRKAVARVLDDGRYEDLTFLLPHELEAYNAIPNAYGPFVNTSLADGKCDECGEYI